MRRRLVRPRPRARAGTLRALPDRGGAIRTLNSTAPLREFDAGLVCAFLNRGLLVTSAPRVVVGPSLGRGDIPVFEADHDLGGECGEGGWSGLATGGRRFLDSGGCGLGGGAARFEGDLAAVYGANCVPCHGLSREGSKSPRLDDERLTQEDTFYLSTILGGRPNEGMSSWAATGMSEAQARAMLAFLQQLRE